MVLIDMWMEFGNLRKVVFESYNSFFGIDNLKFEIGNRYLFNLV